MDDSPARFPRACLGRWLVAMLLGLAPALSAHAQAVGETVINPLTGEEEVIVELLGDTMVLTEEDNVIVIAEYEVGDTFIDPEDEDVTLEVTAVHVNDVTGLVDEITVTDGADPPNLRTFAYVQPVDTGVPVGQEGLPGEPAGPVPVTVPPGNFPYSDPQKGSKGDGGSHAYGVEICIVKCWTIGKEAKPGHAGGTPDPITTVLNGADRFTNAARLPGV